MCSGPNVYMFVYTLIGAQIVPLRPHTFHDSETTYVEYVSRITAVPEPEFQFTALVAFGTSAY